MLIIFFVGFAVIVVYRFYVFFESMYGLEYNKPFFLNLIVFRKRLTKDQLSILNNKFLFYNRLNENEQAIFRHRLAVFMESKQFIGREGLTVNQEMITLISATAVMLTFGFRNYLITLIDKIIIYPREYYSKINETYHRGETNPQLKAIVFSWQDFKKGYRIGDDNLNLGIHEFGHAIHLNAYSNKDISSEIFKQGFSRLTRYLQAHKQVRDHLTTSKYFRAYAYTNQFEFFAVLLENFIETPEMFRTNYPELYQYMKRMLNFNFAGY
ncbi:hypothetical protein BWZ20_06400 [Winogradskyella sp. J14-2]|uniref:zinc-dependent peptidase n=1 Tax=Winogradskyella sp. J14-2 TaxID=1936080 RepID=UPI000972BEF8|nr:zinc-dependent peptidase [Winogradskyella sp. J14-2]APY07956.1 hypothetical protein BWZ20_06400 [Winogradskyella sp. J14-2]